MGRFAGVVVLREGSLVPWSLGREECKMEEFWVPGVGEGEPSRVKERLVGLAMSFRRRPWIESLLVATKKKREVARTSSLQGSEDRTAFPLMPGLISGLVL